MTCAKTVTGSYSQELCRAALLAPVQDLMLEEEESGSKRDVLRPLTMQVPCPRALHTFACALCIVHVLCLCACVHTHVCF
jgi:hypothetical protein